MGDFWKGFWRFLDNPASQAVITGLVCSFVLTLSVLNYYGAVTFTGSPPYFQYTEQAKNFLYLSITVFVGASVVLIFVLYWLLNDSRKDYLHKNRLKLLGKWSVETTVYQGQDENVTPINITGEGVFSLDPEYKKLHLLLTLPAVAGWAGFRHNFKFVTLNISGDQHAIYYYGVVNAFRNNGNVTMNVFTFLNIDHDYKTLSGAWYLLATPLNYPTPNSGAITFSRRSPPTR